MTDGEKNILLNAFKNKDYKIIIESFSYEKRKELFFFMEDLVVEIEDDLGYNVSLSDHNNFFASFFTTDEAKTFFSQVDDKDVKRNLMYCIDDDDYKIELFQKDRGLTLTVLQSLSNDEKLLEAIYKIDENYRNICFYSFIKYFRSDESKIKYIEDGGITDLGQLAELVSCLNDVDLKYQMFNKYIKNLYPNYEKYLLFQLISSIDDQNLKISKLYEYIDEYIKEKFKLVYRMLYLNGEQKDVEFNILNMLGILSKDLDDINKFSILKIYNKLESHLKIEFGYINDLVNGISDFSGISKEEYNYIVSKYIAHYDSINSNHLTLFVSKFGLEALKILDNKNIVKIINLQDEYFIKFLDIFGNKNIEMDMNSINDVYNACIQREFRINNPNEYNIFTLIKDAIDEKDIKTLKELLIKINIFKVFDFDIDTIVNNILNASDKKFYLDKINELTNNYIASKREDYIEIRKEEFYSEVGFEKRYEKNAALKYYFSHMSFDDIDTFIGLIGKINRDDLDEDSKKLISDREKLVSILRFKINPRTEKYNGDKIDIKRFSKILNYMYEHDMIKLEEGLDLKVEYYPKKVNCSSFLPMLIDINVDNLVNNIFKDEDVYLNFLNFLSRYKILGYGDTFNTLFEKCDIDYSSDTFIGLISYFNKIIEKVGNNKNELMSLIDWSNCYSSVSSIYGIVFGMEDFGLLKSNPGPNSASMGRQERLDSALGKVKKMYEREYITIPTIDDDISLSSGSSLHITVGNVTDTLNLTCGERTGACMRIGGAGDTLFDYCIDSENGFHIIFKNPDTGDFVTRVSGFRNGNTIFLNQLRFSQDKKYSTQDIIEACQMVAKMLVRMSKDSNYPIDNVFISSTQAMSGSFKEDDLNIFNPTENLGGFYSDIRDKAIVLATISRDSSFAPINLNQDGIPRYETIRGKCQRVSDRFGIMQGVNKIRIINDILNGVEIDSIEVLSEDYLKDVTSAIIGEDFYILMDKNDNIIEEFIVDKRKNNSRTIREISEIKKVLLNIGDSDFTLENGYSL